MRSDRACRGDRRATARPGCTPFLLVGTAGGVNFGAFDDLAALADIAAAERLWLHVDGAFGALTALAPALAPLTRGLERAHSVAFDFHKWAHAPYDAGFLLVRDAAAHKATFAAPGGLPVARCRAASPPATTGPATTAPTCRAASAR